MDIYEMRMKLEDKASEISEVNEELDIIKEFLIDAEFDVDEAVSNLEDAETSLDKAESAISEMDLSHLV